MLEAIFSLMSEDNSQNDDSINDNSNNKIIPSDTLLQLHNAGFRKLVPVMADSKRANVYDHLITEEEIKLFPLAEGKPVRIMNQNPNFWTEIRLQEQSHLFPNVGDKIPTLCTTVQNR